MRYVHSRTKTLDLLQPHPGEAIATGKREGSSDPSLPIFFSAGENRVTRDLDARWRWYRPPTEKRCYACGEVFPLEEFGVDRGKADGHKSLCKPCDSKKGSAYYARRKREGMVA